MLTAANALAAATASLIRDHDMIGTLSQLCDDCSDVMGAAAVGIMLSDGDAPLEMMAASNHRATDIELYEIQADQGPCIEAARTGATVNVGSADGYRRALAGLRPPGGGRGLPRRRWPARCAGTATSSAPSTSSSRGRAP